MPEIAHRQRIVHFVKFGALGVQISVLSIDRMTHAQGPCSTLVPHWFMFAWIESVVFVVIALKLIGLNGILIMTMPLIHLTKQV